MRIVRNRFLPIGKRYAAINLFGIVFLKKGCSIPDTMKNHESIHTAQMKELLYLPFYIIYVMEWLLRLFQNRFNAYRAYLAISFEREAYLHESDPTYLSHRHRFSQWRLMQRN